MNHHWERHGQAECSFYCSQMEKKKTVESRRSGFYYSHMTKCFNSSELGFFTCNTRMILSALHMCRGYRRIKQN